MKSNLVGRAPLALAILLLFLPRSAARADDRSDLFAAFASAGAAEGKSDVAEAARQYERALALAPAVFGAQSEKTATVMNNLANVYKNLGQYQKAEELHLRCLELRKTILPPDHLDFAQSWGNIANLYLTLGQYPKAIAYSKLSLGLRQRRLGPNDLEVADNLNNLATMYQSLGQFEEAEGLFQRSLQIRETTLGPNDRQTAMSLGNLATLYKDMGQYEKAERLALRALKIYENAFGPEHLSVALAQNNLAIIYSESGQHAKAEPLYQRSLQIKEARLGKDHPDVALALNNLAVHYKILGKYALAEPLYQRAVKIREDKLGRDHPDVAASLINLANVYNDTGRYDEAEPLYDRAAAIFEAALGPNHPELANKALYNLAVLHAAVAKTSRAADDFDRARHIVRRHTAQVLPMLSEREQLAYLENIDRQCYHCALSLGWKHPDVPRTVALSAGWLANGKAVAQESLVQRAALGRDGSKPELLPLVKQLGAARTQLANLMHVVPQVGQEADYKAQLAYLPTLVDSLVKQLRRAGGTNLSAEWIEFDAVRKALPAKSVLVDIVRFGPTVFGAKATKRDREDEPFDMPKVRLPPRYVAWITPPAGQGDVRIVDLGDAGPIEEAIKNYRAAMNDAQTGTLLREQPEAETEKLVQKPLAALARLVLDPLGPAIGDAHEVVLCPDAALWLIPWTALPLKDGGYALEKWNIHFVNSARDLALERVARSTNPPRIFANPNYDLAADDAPGALAAVFGGRLLSPLLTPWDGIPFGLGMRGARGTRSIGHAQSLPGTAQEAQAILPNLAKYAGEPKIYADKQALEGVFKRLASPRVLVLSTHGFFLPAQAPSKPPVHTDDGAMGGGGLAVDQPLENPLLRCGLLLAGCNNRDKITDPNLDDGVLTGMEIVGTDLRGTELVVLSACETGLGQVNDGEGVAGLRQAFQLAGAGAVISTLWQIPDTETATLMTGFFDGLAVGKSKSEALRDAQLAMIQSRRKESGAAHPYYWAAFTLTGQ